MRERRRLAPSLAAAVLLHGVVVAAAARLHLHPIAVATSSLAPPSAEQPIELDESVRPSPVLPERASFGQVGPSLSPSPSLSREQPLGRRVLPAEGGDGTDETHVLDGAGQAGDGWTFSAVARPSIDLGIGRFRVGTTRSANADGPPSGGGRPSDGAMASVRSALDARDHEVGLGAGGPLVGIARETVRASLAPTTGNALFEFRTDGAGIVVSVRLLDASSDARAWDEVAALLARATHKLPLHVPKGALGVAVTMKIESSVRLASSHEAGDTSVSVFGVPVKKPRTLHPIHIDVSSLLTGNIDPTDALLDATSVAQRLVSVWIVEERRL